MKWTDGDVYIEKYLDEIYGTVYTKMHEFHNFQDILKQFSHCAVSYSMSEFVDEPLPYTLKYDLMSAIFIYNCIADLMGRTSATCA